MATQSSLKPASVIAFPLTKALPQECGARRTRRNIIKFPRDQRMRDRMRAKRERDAIYARIGSPFDYGGPRFAMFMTVAEAAPQTVDEMHCWLMLMHYQDEAVSDAEKRTALRMRSRLERDGAELSRQVFERLATMT